MNFMKFLPHAIIIGILAFLMMIIEPLLAPYFVSWIAFQAWAMYFLGGSTVKAAVKTAFCYAAGALAAFAIIQGSAAISLPIIVGIVAFAAILFEKVEFLNFIPAWFVGAGAYFGLANGALANFSHGMAFAVVMVSSILGLVWGFATVVLRTKYQQALDSAKAPASSAAG